MKKVAVIISLLVVASFLGAWVGSLVRTTIPSAGASPAYNTATVLQQVRTLSQLVTVKYVLEKVVILEDAKWYGDSRVLLIAHGVIKAGIDLEKLSAEDIRISDGRIVLKLPGAVITDAYLDEEQTQVLERSTGIMRTFDKDLEQNARRQAVGDLVRAARRAGILNDADDRARAQLRALFQQLGFSEVEFASK